MALLTTEELLALPSAHETSDIVTIEGLGTVRVRALSLSEHREMRRECVQGDTWDDRRWNALLLMRGLAEPELTYDQAVAVTEKVVGPVDTLLAAILRVSGLIPSPGGGMSQKAVDDAEATFPE
jgi:hypothetical protein